MVPEETEIIHMADNAGISAEGWMLAAGMKNRALF